MNVSEIPNRFCNIQKFDTNKSKREKSHLDRLHQNRLMEYITWDGLMIQGCYWRYRVLTGLKGEG